MNDLSKHDLSQKYNLLHPHSEVVEAFPHFKSAGKVLDLGCGGGRNSLYLAQNGFTVDAWDKNQNSIDKLDKICVNEAIKTISTKVVDFNTIIFSGEYDLILSTVVMMFLQPSTILGLLHQMQQATKKGGYNLIVSAMDTDDFPCKLEFFSSTFKHKELSGYYDGWSIKKYNEDTGFLHKTDKNGNRIQLRFATLLAQKI